MGDNGDEYPQLMETITITVSQQDQFQLLFHDNVVYLPNIKPVSLENRLLIRYNKSKFILQLQIDLKALKILLHYTHRYFIQPFLIIFIRILILILFGNYLILTDLKYLFFLCPKYIVFIYHYFVVGSIRLCKLI